jgi:hypothetical protein
MIQAKDGFMADLRYDIQLELRTNAFAHRVVVNGDPFVPDISVLRVNIAKSCYTEAQNFDELGFQDTNPYAAGGPRAHLDPLTCLPKPGKQPEPNRCSNHPLPTTCPSQCRTPLSTLNTTRPNIN